MLRKLNFITIQHINSSSDDTLFKCTSNINCIYKMQGFIVTQLRFDGKLLTLKNRLAGKSVSLNMTSEDKHARDIKCLIRMIKERVRCVHRTLPFQKLPGRLVVELCYASVFWLNCFHPNRHPINGMNPRTLVTGQEVDFARHHKFEFGQYVQTHKHTENSMRARTIGALALRPSRNAEGGYFFFPC